MKKYISILILLLSCVILEAQTLSDKNFIYSVAPQKAVNTADFNKLTKEEVIQNVTYFDGLGRPMQSVGIRAAIKSDGSVTDIITHIGYDDFGRQEKEYLPYTDGVNSGIFRTGNIDLATKNYYTGYYPADISAALPNPYSQKEFEASPLNRVLKQAAPGAVWALNGGHEIKMDSQTNVSAELKVYRAATTWNAGLGLYDISLKYSGNYETNQLYKTITYNENWTSGKNNTTEEFKDKEGRVILKRTYSDYRDTNGTLISTQTPHDTYYVYDDYGNLTYVIPPEVTGNLSSSSVTSNLPYSGNVSAGNSLALTATNSITLTDFHAQAGSTFTASIVSGNSSDLDLFCYQYKYDHRNRLVEKKLPGKEWEYIVYDKLDRPVLTQDPNLKVQNKWLFTKYDAFNRPVYTGIINSAKDRSGLQVDLNLETIHFESRRTTPPLDGISTYYTNNSFPRTGIVELHTINYYDDYGFDKDGGDSESVGSMTPSTTTKSLATGSKIRVLGSTNWITNVIYYDKKGLPIYNYSKNNFLGSVHKVKTELNFVGKPTRTTTTHEKNNVTNTIVDNFAYDHQGRLLTQIQKINNQAEELIVSNVYDELGQLKEKGVGGKVNQSRLQTVDYTYNIRGWLKGINDNGVGTTNSSITMGSDDLFGFKINYNNPSTGTPLYNGNISQTFWKTTNPLDTSLRNYNYNYDALNRLTGAQYSLSIPNRYNENLTYDKNGNIKTLIRTGNYDVNATTFGTMDNLLYTYFGNRLTKVEDSSGSAEGFKDGNITGDDYSYDANGNMTKDLNKGIASDISYNHLNLPTQIALGTGNIQYVYDATGVKQRKIVTPGLTTDYDNGFQYEKASGTEVLKFFPTSEGYAENNNGTFLYIYQYKDHLGNVRLSYRDVGTTTPSLQIVEESNYYPFGLKQKVAGEPIINSSYKYKFLGQERQDELGLNWDTFRHRNYDYAIGRFFGVDPVSEEYMSISTYQFAHNNPVWKIELEGLEGKETQGKDITNHEPIKLVNSTRQAGAPRLAPYAEMKVVQETTEVVVEYISRNLVRTAGTVAATVGAVLWDYMSPNYGGRTSEIQKPSTFTIDEKFNVKDYKVEEKTIEETGIKRFFEDNSKHGKDKKGRAGKAPENPQEVLDDSFELPGNTTRRVGVDYKTGEFNVFDEHSEGKFHGHVRTWNELSQDMKNILLKQKVVTKKGKIINQE